MNSDNLIFNELELAKQIEFLENVRDKIQSINRNYMDYIINTLKPNWKTTGGEHIVNLLQRFSDEKIKDFVIFLNQRINDLTNVKEKVNIINLR